MQKSKTPDCLFAPELDACLSVLFKFYPLSLSFTFLRSLSAFPNTVNSALSVGICV